MLLNLGELKQADIELQQKAFWLAFAEDSQRMIANVRTEFRFAIHNRSIIPISVNDTDYDNSYVASTYNGVVTYPLEELRLLPSAIQRLSVASLIHGVSPALRFGKVNRAVVVNNWLLSTNLYPTMDLDWLDKLLSELRETFPQHAILFRSLNEVTNSVLLEHLRRSGFLLAPSRQVYLFDGHEPNFIDRHNNRIDSKLLQQSSYQVVSYDAGASAQHDFDQHRLDQHYSHIQQLYDWLYLDRYSRNNPQFTAQLMKLWRETGMLKFFGLQNASGSLDGIVGLFACEGAVTVPVVGYDTSKPKSLGLYRRLMAIALRESVQQKWMLNLSSGAASFKRLRGGRAQIEYTAVACDHLPIKQRIMWRSLAGLLQKVAAPLLERYEL